MIESLTNEHIKKIAKLNEKKYRDEEGLFLVEGIHLVEEAKKKNLLKEIITTITDTEGTLVSVEVMKKITKTESPVKMIGVCKKMETNTLSNHVLILDNVQDPGNVGTLIRSALAFDFKTIVLDNCADPYSPKVVRSTQGAIFQTNLIIGSAIDYIGDMKTDGYTLYGTSLQNGYPLKSFEKNEKLGIVLGNEGNGVRKEILDMMDKNIFIEINEIESLNVAIAGGIIMYYLG